MEKKSLTNSRLGVTLIELTIVIGMIILLVSGSFVATGAYVDWKKGLEAGETLKAVYQAQRLYLADNPTKPVSNIQAADIIPYLPNGASALPTVTGLDGVNYGITVNVSPPVITGYTDPSSSTDDGQWDAGK